MTYATNRRPRKFTYGPEGDHNGRNANATVEYWVEALASRQRCSTEWCNAALEPIFKAAARDADTWFWHECETCQSPCCEECTTETDAGAVICSDCEVTAYYRQQILADRRK